ncbi:hypothetical protein QTO34_008415 [Cnephaeus nilssonii]|uniref:3CxxC-type domain-containing protein n=1 Tax=Cnephaeus nilssonii TaxID=3371016 RepID=A0AA40IBE8_CNENI|nr:hypothetical protein QTO34_008415 [Eptesicus nilssonii]
MASLGDEALDGYMYSACAAYPYPCLYPPAARGKGLAGGGGWRPRAGDHPPAASALAGAAPPSLPGYGQLMAAEYFDSFQRAQLMALLSQVNPRRDASVQCSLGRRTLPRRPRDAGAPAPGPEDAAGGPASPQPARPGPEPGSPPGGGPRLLRFPRSVAVYSPVVSRRAPRPRRRLGSGGRPLRGPAAPSGESGRRGRRPSGRRPRRRRRREEAEVRASWEPSADAPGLPSREARGGEAAPRSASGSSEEEQPPPVGGAQDGEGERSPPRSPEPGKERLRFQFLEQKYGYYHCKDCNIRWESAYVWCVQGTNKVYFKQFCRTCQKSYNPYRVEAITCQSCKQTRCSCSIKLRHIDPKRPHRQDLCGRCKGKRLSCDSTFSFKYII